MYLDAVNWIKRGGALAEDPHLLAQLTATTYTFDNKGRMLIEPKDMLKAKLNGQSPDEADAFVLTFAEPVTSARRINSPSAASRKPTTHSPRSSAGSAPIRIANSRKQSSHSRFPFSELSLDTCQRAFLDRATFTMSLQDAPTTDEAGRLAEAVRLKREKPELGYIRLGAMVGLHKDKVRRAVEHAERRDGIASSRRSKSILDRRSNSIRSQTCSP